MAAIIVVGTGKGGAGKTTAAIVLGCTLAKTATVTLIDADPSRHPVTDWAALPGKPENLAVITNHSEEGILDEIDEAASQSQFVIVDLEGVSSRRVDFAINRASLVIIPMKEERQDARAAVTMMKAVLTAGKANIPTRHIPFAVLFTQGNAAVKSRTAMRESRALREHPHIPVFDVELHKRDAFSAIYTTGGGVHELDQKEVNNVPKAIENAEAFAREVVERLRSLRAKGAA